MIEFLKVLLNIRSLKAACRELSLAQIKESIEKLQQVYDERYAAEATQRIEAEKREQKLAEYLALMAAQGIKPEDLIGQSAVKSTQREPKAPKYRYQLNGVEKTWTGQGRAPKPIAEALAAGHLLDEFAINKAD